MKRSLLCPFIAAILLCASTIHPQERPNGDQSAPDVVRKVVNNELNTRKEDHIHWMYQLETDKSGARERIKFIETIEGNLTRLHSEWRSIALRLAPWSLVLFAPNKCLLVYDSFAFRTIAREKSHEPTMATDVFLAGIQEQEPLPRSSLFALLPACRWISFRSRGRKPPQARIHGPDANCRAARERSGKGARL